MSRVKYDWDNIRSEYLSGCVTMKELSMKYGIPLGSITAKSSVEGWGKMKKRESELCADFISAVTDDEGELDREKLRSVIFDGFSGRRKLTQLRDIAEALTGKVSEAVFDELQFNRYIVSEKGTDENGKAVTLSVEKCFDKLDTKALKEMVGTLKVLTECVRSLWGIPTFGETARLYLADKSEDNESDGGITVEFMEGEEFSA